MAPPGRRKSNSLVTLLPLLLLVLFSTSASAASAVLGIDLGTGYLKAALVKPGSPLEIVLTKDSKRKEAAALAFKPSRAQSSNPDALPERLYGADALSLAARFPADVYPSLKSILGVPFDDGAVKEYSNLFPGLDIEKYPREDAAGGTTVAFKSQAFGKEQDAFMVEELLAMELQNIKASAEAATGKGSVITDVVITYPAYYTAQEKRAVETVAELAGLKPLGLISDGLAVGLNYATGRQFESVSDGGKPEHHLVYDMGAGSTTATVLKFQGRRVKDGAKRNKTIQEVRVLGTGWDSTLGGNALNQLIVEDMVATFLEKPQVKQLGLEAIHVKNHPKTMARFRKEAERLRQVLSANAQTTASLEGVYYEDVNFQYKISRADFEALAAEHSARVRAPLVSALDSAGVTLEDLDSIILHGGAVRTPFVQRQLESVAGRPQKIKTNVNADEAAVLGAAFKAASLSRSFRVKDIRSLDTSGFAVGLKWAAEGKERQQKLFTPTSQIGTEKQVPIKTPEDLKFQFTQTVGDVDKPITEVEATNSTDSVAILKDKYGCAPANISTEFTVRLSHLDGLPEIVSGSVSCEAETTKEGSVINNVKGLFGFGSKKGAEQEPLQSEGEGVEQEPLQDEGEGADTTTMTPLPVDDHTSSGSTVASPSISPSSSDTSLTLSKPTPTTISIPLALSTRPLGSNIPLSSEGLSRILSRLSALATSDASLAARAEALNTLEAFTYSARDLLSDESFIAASATKAREQLEDMLGQTTEWLYADGTDAGIKDFEAKLKSLKALVDPVLARRDEAEKREPAIRNVRDQLEQLSSMIQMVKADIQRTAEKASLAAAEARSSATSVTESVAEAATASADPGAVEPDDLDDDPYSTTSSPSATKSSPAEPGLEYEAIMPAYTAEDLSTLEKSYESAKSWLDTKLAAQKKLGPSDDPVVRVRELEAKARQLQKEVMDLLTKSMRRQGPGGSKGGSGGKKKGPKSKSNNNGNNGSGSGTKGKKKAKADSSGTSAEEATATTGKMEKGGRSSSSSSSSRKDEL